MTQESSPYQRRVARRVALGVAGAVAVSTAFIVCGFLVKWLWAATVSDIFGWKEISFWQAWGLLLLSQILLKANFTSSTRRSRRGRRSRSEASPA